MKSLLCFLAFLALLSIAPVAAVASPGYYLVTTYDQEDEASIEFEYWNVKSHTGPAVNSPEIGLGYGVTSRWYTELFVADFHADGGPTTLSNFSWQNDFMLTQGQYPVDVAIHTLIKRYHNTDSGIGFEFGPVLQTDIDRLQLNGNLFFERNYQDVQSNRMQMKYQWQARYRWKTLFSYGLQGFGELGEWRHWAPYDEQSHRIGPAVFSTVHLAHEQDIKFDAAVLGGSISGKHAKTFVMRAQYNF